jgi:hypothetical protein
MELKGLFFITCSYEESLELQPLLFAAGYMWGNGGTKILHYTGIKYLIGEEYKALLYGESPAIMKERAQERKIPIYTYAEVMATQTHPMLLIMEKLKGYK